VYVAKDAGTTQRLPATALLAVDSEDRFASMEQARLAERTNPFTKSPYAFTFSKGESLVNGYIRRIGLSEVVIPWVIPNINPKTNKIQIHYISFDAGIDTSAVIQLPNGFYRPADLAAAMQVAVRALDPTTTIGLSGFTMVYGLNNMTAFTYNTNSGARVSFNPMQSNYNAGAYYYPYDTTLTRQLFDVLGMTVANSIVTDTQGTTGATLCQAINYIDVVCDNLTAVAPLKDTMSQRTARDSLCRIYLTTGNEANNVLPSSATFAPPGTAPFTLYRAFPMPKMIAWLPNVPVPSALNFSVYDDQGAPLSESDPFFLTGVGGYATNRTNWSLTCLLSEN